ncbi:hypothetical protein A9Q99_00400 [Gammaproteobacteria bacterium 45_16_T64]|nr:hypothetical protein A9Q99_00400 [Gammaproteobacteria bacterium 45_16_T64]
MKIGVPFIYIGVFLLISMKSMAADLDFSALQNGWEEYRNSEYDNAIESWEGIGLSIPPDERTQDNMRIAGLALILSSKTYEILEDDRAYRTWATALTYFLESNIRWKDYSASLRNKIKENIGLMNDVTGDFSTNVLPSDAFELGGALSLLLEIENSVSLSSYEGPSPGLGKKEEDYSYDESILAKRNYLTRPLVTRDEEFDNESLQIEEYTDVVDGQDQLREERDANRDSDGSYIEIDNIEPYYQASTEGSDVLSANNLIDALKAPPKEHVEVRSLGMRGIGSEIAGVVDVNLKKTAESAWRYFEKNTNGNTGFVNATHGYKFITMWGVGSHIAALISTNKLGVLDDDTFEKSVSLILHGLNTMPLYQNEMPNRQYTTSTLEMVDLRQKTSDVGSGWSAVGVGRLLIWLGILNQWYPRYSNEISDFIARLDFDRALSQGNLNGAINNGVSEKLFDEGRFGYEQYASYGYLLWGGDPHAAQDYDTVSHKAIYQVQVPYDTRSGSHLVIDPFMLAAMELPSLGKQFDTYSRSLYTVQKKHGMSIGRPVAQTEMNLNRSPWFVYHDIYYSGSSWQVVTYNGEKHQNFAGFSSHGVFMLDAVFDDKYTRGMMLEIDSLNRGGLGFYSGRRYDGEIVKALSSNSSAAILESILYRFGQKKPFIVELKTAQRND